MIPYKPIHTFDILGLKMSSWGVILFIAAALGFYLAYKEAKREKIDAKKFLYMYPWLIVGGYIGSRLMHYYGGFGFEGSILEIFDITSIGSVFYGGFLGALLAGFIYTQIRKQNFWKWADIAAPFIALGISIVRIGCFLDNHCGGIRSDLPWAVVRNGIARHPTQIYSSIFGLALFVFLIWLRKKKKFDGFLFLMFLLIYSVFRFLIEFIRTEPKIFLSLSLAQWISILIFIPTVIYLYKNK